MDIIDNVIKEFFPDKSFPRYQRQLIKWLFGERKLLRLLQESAGKHGTQWVQFIAEKFQFGDQTQQINYNNLPKKGPVIVISNHPTVIDGIILINTISRVRKDIKIVANHVLPEIFPPIKDIAIGIKNMTNKMGHRQFAEMNNHLKNGGVLVICPAGKLASITLKGLQEQPWHVGFVQLAVRNKAALIPVNIQGKNSLRYYITALLWRKLSNLMLIRECMRHQGKKIKINVGEQIRLTLSDSDKESFPKFAEECQQHALLIGNGQQGILPTCSAIAQQENKRDLANAINQCETLKVLRDGKIILLYRYHGEPISPILNELGRLREICFRASGAGSGATRDNDRYDFHYSHIILWESAQAEIIGAYRVQPVGELLSHSGIERLYSYSLFKYKESFLPQVEKSIEIGRGFIQPHYQKSNALDCLWRGIFCFTQRYPEYKYLLGALTIPNACNFYAQQLIVNFYQIYFSTDEQYCLPVKEYPINNTAINNAFSGGDFSLDWKRLKEGLEEKGCELPWPYKQAATWYQPGGSKILSFAEDSKFNSIVALNFCEIENLKGMYRKHYIENPS